MVVPFNFLSLDVCILCLLFLAYHVNICIVFLSIYHNKTFHHIIVSILKVLALTVVCILSSCEPLCTAWYAFTLLGIPVWAGTQLIVGLCVNLDAASQMALVIVFKSSFLLFSMFTAVKEYLCIVILFLVCLASSKASCMAVM